MNIGNAIRLYRLQRRLTQNELAEAANVSSSYLSLLENGRRNAEVSTLESIASALNTPLFMLFMAAVEDSELMVLPHDIREKIAYIVMQSMKERV